MAFLFVFPADNSTSLYLDRHAQGVPREQSLRRLRMDPIVLVRLEGTVAVVL